MYTLFYAYFMFEKFIGKENQPTLAVYIREQQDHFKRL